MKKLFFIDRNFALESVIEKVTPHIILLLQAKYLNLVAELKYYFDAYMTVKATSLDKCNMISDPHSTEMPIPSNFS